MTLEADDVVPRCMIRGIPTLAPPPRPPGAANVILTDIQDGRAGGGRAGKSGQGQARAGRTTAPELPGRLEPDGSDAAPAGPPGHSRSPARRCGEIAGDRPGSGDLPGDPVTSGVGELEESVIR